MYHDALCTLDNSVSGCMVSPPLMGSSGVMPLTVISVYVFHYSCIFISRVH